MEAVIELVIWVWHTLTIGRVVLPGTVGVCQSLSTDFIEVINVNVDVVITITVIAAMVIPVIIMMVIVVVIPVDVAEDGIGCGNTEAEA